MYNVRSANCFFTYYDTVPSFHLEIDPRGGLMSIYEKEGGEALCTCA